MNVEKELAKGHSRPIATRVAKWAVQDTVNMKQLMAAFFDGDDRTVQRAAWSVGLAGDLNPDMLKPYLKKMVKLLNQPVHNAVKRNVLRVFQTMEIPVALEGELADASFRLMADPKEAIAIQTFAMTVVYRLLPKYPELKTEFKMILEDQFPYAAAAFKSRARKYLQKLNQETIQN